MIDDRKLRMALRTQWVPRWTIIPTNRRQSVAEHQHGSLVILMWLLGKISNPIVDKLAAVEYAATHDGFESVTGDVPSPSKAAGLVKIMDPYSGQGDPIVKGLVKLSDLFEAMVFINHELDMGNESVSNVFEQLYERALGVYTENDWMPGIFETTFAALWRDLYQNTRASYHPGMFDI